MFPSRAVQPVTAEEYVVTLMTNIQGAHNAARDKLRTSLKRMKRDYDVRVLQRKYSVGDLIYLLDTAAKKGKCKKLCSPWKGPAVVIKVLSASLYQVKLHKSVFVVNHDRMKPCKDRDIPGWVATWLANPTQDDTDKGDDGTPYCVCRRPWQGQFMIQCDGCDEWFHRSCVNVTASEALDIDKYWCAECD